MNMNTLPAPIDVVMLGTFAVWTRGTLQARALPLAQALRDLGIRCALITTPWDMPRAAGVVESNRQIPIVNTRRYKPEHALLAVSEQLAWVRKLQPRLVHVFKPKGFGGLTARFLLARLPVVVDSDDWEGDGGWNDQADYGFLERRLFDWQERELQRRADAVTAASSLLQRRAVALRGNQAARVQRLPNGLSQDWIEALAAAGNGPRPERTVVLYSRFAEFPDEWLPRYLQALESAETEPLTLSVVGEIPDAVRGQLPACDDVRLELHGYVERERIPALLADATLAIYPYSDSLIARSKQSVKLLELMTSGLPVIASNVGDVAATLGAAGLILPDDSPQRFARATLELLDLPYRRDAMQLAGPARIRAEYTFDRLGSTLLDLYRELGLQCGA